MTREDKYGYYIDWCQDCEKRTPHECGECLECIEREQQAAELEQEELMRKVEADELEDYRLDERNSQNQ